MAGMVGLNPEQIEQMAQQIKAQADAITDVIARVTSQVNTNVPANWAGQDAQQFKGDWEGQLRTSLQNVVNQLDQFATIAKTNVQKQREVSNSL
ncbi:WXG100 family type VII secretion target [Rhodococcus sp. IEGM 1379]|uniref:WXG100 family type VII secretion target n=1 Tax=Rhodococcus sp. IEGM 1379 TaxID=3047086 RepID=UPI0024B73E32|nr:WXG100 family type VII secretion target [Rhodococcus sp. IEGM 1379]MDI9914250.1 WXG100 family type VII secretion target [Rhodococcus sp. IEGM 1379]